MIQAGLGWEDQHLYWFRIFGLRYGGGYVDLNRLLLIALRQRASEHLIHNHFAGWEHELHIDAAGPTSFGAFTRVGVRIAIPSVLNQPN